MSWLYRIFRLFFTPKCSHRWNKIAETNSNLFERSTDSMPIGMVCVRELECKICGEIKFIKFK